MNNLNSEFSSTDSDENKSIQNNKKQKIIVEGNVYKNKKEMVE